ncbi:WhiB family transcriptional regulator [Mycobacterium sp. URHB0021]
MTSTSESLAANAQPLACQQDPERWFDRTDRTRALAGCLQCPARPWCAGEALAVRPVFGMWAGIWIDRNFADAAHYLHAIVEISPSATPPPPAATVTAAPTGVPAAPVRRVSTRVSAARASVAALITARSTGHCEILAPNCLLDSDGICTRIPGRLPSELCDTAAGYVACRRCRQVVTNMHQELAHRLGYLVEARGDPADTPFYWRQSRWMMLDSGGSAVLASERHERHQPASTQG